MEDRCQGAPQECSSGRSELVRKARERARQQICKQSVMLATNPGVPAAVAVAGVVGLGALDASQVDDLVVRLAGLESPSVEGGIPWVGRRYMGTAR